MLAGALKMPDAGGACGTRLCLAPAANWDWVDPLKDARAEIEQIEAGLKSRAQALSERGYDAEQVDVEIAADRARERRLGLAFGAAGQTGATPDAPPATTED
ncbi:MAG: hypothetical protein KatS3mg118_3371 [Paracoccaceae bacterium]|nr:MAG: hypothetical protein KatS3mg118_3371 [Paracoccaceae bacterium]